ncbi:MAG: recombinase family protein [Proteobacteria bacterium]|nr:recombinase family protein [Pseudomonadota bacterium]
MKCYSYIRFSSKEQVHKQSIKEKLDDARKFASEKKWELDESLCMYDLGLSGFHNLHRTKGAFGVFLKAVEDNKIPVPSALIVENHDRLSRDTVLDALAQFINIINAGITIVTLMDGQVYNRESLTENHSQLLISISIMARSHEESKVKQRRRTKGWVRAKENARTGIKMKARCVAWLRLNDDTGDFEEIDEHVQTIKRIYELYNSGHGLYGICKILNGEKRPTFHKKTKGWGSTSVRRILTTRAVIGEIQFTKTSSFIDGKRIMVLDGEPIKNYYPPVIDEDIFYKAQELQKIKKCSFGKIGEMNNLFSKIVKCGYCSATMQYNVRGRNKIKYLNCRESKRGACDVRLVISFRYQDLEDVFIRSCNRLHLENIITDNISEHQQKVELIKAKLITTTQKIELSQNKVENFTNAISMGTKDTISHFVEMINQEKIIQNNLSEQRQNISDRLSELEKMHDRTENSLKNVKFFLELLSSPDESKRLEARRKLQKHIRELVEKINIYPRGKAYKILLENQELHSEKQIKNLYHQRMNEYREVEIIFRAGGKLVFVHDHETGGLQFSYEMSKNGRPTDESINNLPDDLRLLAEETLREDGNSTEHQG